MHLYLQQSPRALYLVTASRDGRPHRPGRVLVFRAAEGRSAQAVVEFLTKDQVNLAGAIKVTNRIIKGCLGLISVEGGKYQQLVLNLRALYRSAS